MNNKITNRSHRISQDEINEIRKKYNNPEMTDHEKIMLDYYVSQIEKKNALIKLDPYFIKDLANIIGDYISQDDILIPCKVLRNHFMQSNSFKLSFNF